MKIVVLDDFFINFGGVDWTPVTRQAELVLYAATDSEEQAIERLHDADGVYTNRFPISERMMECCPKLKFIQTFGTGLDKIDTEAAKKRGVTVCNVPVYGRGAVAQMALALMFALARNTAAFDRKMKTEGWDTAGDGWILDIPQTELTGRTLGIIGMGDIGYAVAKIAMAMEMQVLATRRTPDLSLQSEQLRFCSLEELLQQSDIISIHCPLNDETRGLINRIAISQMKDGVLLINTARGAVLDEAAVVEALDSGKIAGVGVDVFAIEPPGRKNALALHPKCIATPHVAWMPLQTRQRIIDIAGQNLRTFLESR